MKSSVEIGEILGRLSVARRAVAGIEAELEEACTVGWVVVRKLNDPKFYKVVRLTSGIISRCHGLTFNCYDEKMGMFFVLCTDESRFNGQIETFRLDQSCGMWGYTFVCTREFPDTPLEL